MSSDSFSSSPPPPPPPPPDWSVRPGFPLWFRELSAACRRGLSYLELRLWPCSLEAPRLPLPNPLVWMSGEGLKLHRYPRAAPRHTQTPLHSPFCCVQLVSTRRICLVCRFARLMCFHFISRSLYNFHFQNVHILLALLVFVWRVKFEGFKL